MSPTLPIVFFLHGLTFYSIFVEANTKCELFSNQNLEIIIDYVKWRKMNHLIFLDDDLKSGNNIMKLSKHLKCFNKNNIFINLCTHVNATKNILGDGNKNVVIVTVLKPDLNREKFISIANQITSYGETTAWLIVTCKINDTLNEHILDILGQVSFEINSNVVLALNIIFPVSESQPMEFEIHCRRNITKRKISRSLERILPFYNEANESVVDISSFCINTTELTNVTMCILQIYKIRKNLNTSLVIQPLGFWNSHNGFEDVENFKWVENRLNFLEYPLIVGTKNSSGQINTVLEQNAIEESNDEENMKNILDFIVSYLNATQKLVNFTKLGTKEANGEWTDLLGAVAKKEVDFALDPVIKSYQKYTDMTFSHNIMESIRNIYVKPEKSSKLRDIFTVPFGQNLLLSLLGTTAIITLIQTIYNKIVTKVYHTNEDQKIFRHFSDSTVWCVAIFSMQGNISRPRTYAGNIITIVSLLCALIIYNSYSAFITSILSVQLMNIRTVDDLLNSDYDIGYAKNSNDEIYLRSTDISQLNQIYLRGYLDNKINNITEGLMKTTKGNYGFFATGHIARKDLLDITSYKCTYDIVEIPVYSTRNNIAFPMSKKSPFQKLINLCIIRMYETGIHSFIKSQISPAIPQCKKEQTYQSARLSDLSTAFFILALGAIIAHVLLILEGLWKKRGKLHRSIKKKAFHLNVKSPSFPIHSGLYPPPLRVVGRRSINTNNLYLE